MTIRSNKYMWILLAKHFAGETGIDEEHKISEWLKNPENYTLFNKIKSDWNIMENMKTKFDVDHAWTKLHQRIADDAPEEYHDAPPGSHKQQKIKPYQTLTRIAASVLFFVGAGFILYTSGIFPSLTNRTIHVVTLADEAIKTVSLPDGSQVYLNSGTTLSYPRQFKGKIRRVSLTGEAFFDVAADQSNPFTIAAYGALVRAVGTSFNINTEEREQTVDVFVESGKVELMEANNINNRILVKPGYIGTFALNRIESIKTDDKNCIAWKTRQMNFHHTPLSEVLDILQNVYKVEIIIREPGIDSTQIIGEYNNDPLEDILEVICTQNHLKVEKSDNKIYLSGI